jgi:hypothetical protein
MRRAEPLAGLGGLALFASEFLSWYAPGPELLEPGIAVSVGRTYGLADLVLLVLGLLAVAVPLTSLLTKGPAAAIRTAVLASAFGWIAIVIVARRVLLTPETIVPSTGAYVALAGAIVAWVGSWLSMRDESTPGATLPVLERLPAR